MNATTGGPPSPATAPAAVATTIDQEKLQFERDKWRDEASLRERDLTLRERAERQGYWRSPLIIAILTAAAAAGSNTLISWMNARAQRAATAAGAENQMQLERLKSEQNLIVEAIKTGGDVRKAAANIEFLVKTGLISDAGRAAQISSYLIQNQNRPERLPSLPSLGVVPGNAPPVRVTDAEASVTTRARALKIEAACAQQTAAGNLCVQDAVLVAPQGKPIALIDAKAHGQKLQPPQAIVLHFTASPDKAAVRLFSQSDDPMRKASAHIVIEHDGTITQLIPFDIVAFHAGSGTWNGLTGLNTKTLSIELSNWGQLQGAPGSWRTPSGRPVPSEDVVEIPNSSGKVEGWERFNDAQLAALEQVIRAMIARYPAIRAVIGHSDIARFRLDPGPALPIERYRALLAKK